MTTMIIFSSQLLLVFFKHLTVRAVSNHNVIKSMIYTSLIQISWLVSSALGIDALLNHNWIDVMAYIVGGVLGTYLNFKIKI